MVSSSVWCLLFSLEHQGLYAVGNFLPSEESMLQQRDALRSLTELNQDPSRVLSAKNGSSSDGIAHTEGILNRNHRDASSLTNLKRANADVEIITPRSPMGKESMVTFSNTLPRANTPSVEDPVRRNASIHASMDSARSKQLLTQWKSKNESRKMSLQVMDTEPEGQSPPRSIEMRSSSEPSRVGVNGDHHVPGNQYLKIQPGSVPGCNNSMPGGPRVSIQSRPGSSQLVHIPEETQENISTSPKSSSARAKWLKAAEKTVACNRSNSQPRIMQVIAMSKQQGVLQSSPKNAEGSTVTCTGSIRYKTLTDHEPGGIVRVEAHPENNRPIIQIPSTTEGEGSGSWKWKAPEKGSLRQTYELNDLNRDSESCESLKDSFGSGDRKRSNIDSNEHHHHGITTIRVTPVEGSEIGSETLSVSSSRDSTLRRKGNIILIPERSNSPENTRNIFYKGTSPTRAYKDWAVALRVITWVTATTLKTTRLFYLCFFGLSFVLFCFSGGFGKPSCPARLFTISPELSLNYHTNRGNFTPRERKSTKQGPIKINLTTWTVPKTRHRGFAEGSIKTKRFPSMYSISLSECANFEISF